MEIVVISRIQINKILTIILTISFIGSLVLLIFLSIYYVRTMPDKPQPALGRSTPLNIHGWVVYITRNQALFLDYLFWLGLFGSFFGIAILRILHLYGRKKGGARNRQPRI